MKRNALPSSFVAFAIVGFLQLQPILAIAEPWTRHTIDNTSQGADGVRAADTNGDSRPDIATGWEEGGVTRVYLHPGPNAVKRPWPSVTVGLVSSPEDAVFADLDADGAMDVITSCEGDERTVYVHWAPNDPNAYNDPAAWKTESFPVSTNRTRWMFALPLDVDSDGDTDLVMGSKDDGAGIGWLLCPDNPRDVAAWTWEPAYEGQWIMSIQAHDVDDDGHTDLLVTDRKGPNRGVIWLRRGSDSGAWRIDRIGPVDEAEVMFLWAGRTTPDSPFQVVVGARDTRTIFEYTRHGENDWRTRSGQIPDRLGTPKGVAVADLDRDGRHEIVLSCENAKDKLGLVALHLDTFDLAWDIAGPEGVKFDRIELLDLDDDSDLDILTCEERAGLGVVWYENPLR